MIVVTTDEVTGHRVTQVFGSGGPRAFQFGVRIGF